ncbi:SDR family oxidoreductase [Kordiimonas sp.]|uniref:SDR family oxidoreductase n=1 Tax=Kordiimonas sp. TaxID=1970157 RepID=UPI003A91517F
MTIPKPHLFVFGPGYSASPVMARALENGWNVSASYRDDAKANALNAKGITAVPLDKAALQGALATCTHMLTSVAPGPDGDPVLPIIAQQAERLHALRWVGYLSSTNVYGNHDGGWVDEKTPATPSLERGKRRIEAELSWHDFCGESDSTLHIFRLAGIYGPGRNAVRTVLDGRAKRIFKEGQLFSRIHVSDIEECVWQAMNSGLTSRIFNLADDAPAPPQDIIEKAALALGKPVPALIPLDEANLSPMARSFYEESKRVKNDRVKKDLSLSLKYPSFDSALNDLIAHETSAQP